MPLLLIVEPGNAVRLAPLKKRVITLGSGAGCDIFVREAADLEANLVETPRGWTVQPYARKPLLEVDGKRLKKEVSLKHGALLSIADTKALFSLNDTQAVEPAEDTPRKQGKSDAGSRFHDKMRRFTADLARDFSVDSLLTGLLDGLIDLCEADRGFLLLRETDGYRVKAARNVAAETIDEPQALLSDSIVRQVLDSGEPLLVSDAVSDDRFNSARSVIDLKLNSVLAVPLLIKGDALGVIYLGNNSITNHFDGDTLDLAGVFAGQAALLLTNLLAMRELSQELEDKRLGEMLGSCSSMLEVFRKIERVAKVDVDVLVTGETGTGKELVALEIHRLSERSGRFVTINCGAIPENLIESELFGHVRGAFTGAVKDRPGCFQSADQGTLFLDEIGELAPNLQVKLLRVLQEKTVTKVGSDAAEAIDVRVVAATHRNLEEDVEAGRFREDLLYRLNVVPLEVPPLRQRGDDVLVLAKYFFHRYREQFKSPVTGLSREALEATRAHQWPGNIRELENRLKRALVLNDGLEITAEDLGLRKADEPPMTLQDAKEEFQAEYIDRILEMNGGNRTKTASDLGVDPRTIYRHLAKKRGMDEDEFMEEESAKDPV